MDWLLLSQLLKNETPSLPEAFLPVMDQRQYGLWLWGQGRFEELLKLYPTPFYFLMAGTEDFNKGDYSRAIERLERSFDLACQEGQAVMMLEAKMFLGGCYSAVGRFEQMQFHYKVAENLARALKDKDALESLRYNTAATALQLGRTEEAYAYFSSLSQPDALSCHKLAICCEKLRKPQEALNALSRAETAPCALDRGLVSDLCAPVRYRLEHPGSYLREEEYQKLLFHCFERVQKELHRGFALFHLEWMEEWYAANRQYKQAYELIREFSQL